ncbi:unnamed protein product [Mytilus coruscus]|uniref:C-type lectin domain-containing protein n=1 Tax=Mytilus coruscus TaxID=42192 RepID=A0A6J8BNR5_MYTCO|nr:unnamed protein product [Mytilus coruscus]
MELEVRAVWLGGTDSAKEGNWVWGSSGKPLTFVDWKKSEWGDEPNNYGRYGENCMQLSEYDDYNAWYDVRCQRFRGFICEKRITAAGRELDVLTHRYYYSRQRIRCSDTQVLLQQTENQMSLQTGITTEGRESDVLTDRYYYSRQRIRCPDRQILLQQAENQVS